MAATFNIRDKFDVGFTILRLPRSWLRKVAGFLNYMTAGDFIDITKPDNPSLETPVKVSVAYAALLAQLQQDIGGGEVPDNVLTTDDIGVTVPSQEDFTELHDDTQQLADDFDAHLTDFEDLCDNFDGLCDVVDGILADYLSTADINVTVAAKDHTHSGYSQTDHTHGFITADGKLSNCQSAGCLVVTDALGRITHSDSNPLAKDVADLVKQWIDNDREIGGGSITHDKITDWASATAGFATDDDVAALDAAFDSLAGIVDGLIATCLTQGDINVTVAAKDHTHTTANISDWGTATAQFVTDADLSGYALEADLLDLAADVVDMASEIIDINDDLDDLYSWYGTGASSATMKVVTGVTWNGTKLAYTYRNIPISHGLITSVPGSDSSTDIDTPAVITWS